MVVTAKVVATGHIPLPQNMPNAFVAGPLPQTLLGGLAGHLSSDRGTGKIRTVRGGKEMGAG